MPKNPTDREWLTIPGLLLYTVPDR